MTKPLPTLPIAVTAVASGASARGPSRLAALNVCERAWALRYYYWIRQNVDNEYRMGGSLIHTCYEYYYATKMSEEMRKERCPWFYRQTLQERLEEQGRDFPELVEMAKENLAAYMQVYSHEPVRPLWIEREFSATLGEIDPGGPHPELDDEVVTCRSDLVFENDDGIWIMDYKSVGAQGTGRDGRLWRWKANNEYALNLQVLVNLHLVRRVLGAGRVRGFIIQRTTRQGPYDFDRHVLSVPMKAYKETPRQLRYAVQHEMEVARTIQEGGRPKPSFNACFGRYGACDYRDACMAKDDAGFQAVLRRDFDVPQLKVVTQ